VNLGNPVERTISELAKLVLQITGSSSTVEYYPLPVDDPTRRRPEIKYAHDVLGWQPEIQLEEGLDRTISWLTSRAALPGKSYAIEHMNFPGKR
jgi:nucleoside-diphosphate-sugar epimerase